MSAVRPNYASYTMRSRDMTTKEKWILYGALAVIGMGGAAWFGVDEALKLFQGLFDIVGDELPS